MLFTPYQHPTALSALQAGQLLAPAKALAIRTPPGLVLASQHSSPHPSFVARAVLGMLTASQEGDSWSCPCWGISLEGDAGGARLLLWPQSWVVWPQGDGRR